MLSGFSLEKVFPFQRNFVTIGGYQMHYVDEGPTHGTPPVIVCLHGNPTWSFYFRELIRDTDPRKVKAVMDAMMTMVKLDVAALEAAYAAA